MSHNPTTPVIDPGSVDLGAALAAGFVTAAADAPALGGSHLAAMEIHRHTFLAGRGFTS